MIKQENLAIVTLKKGEGRTIKAGGAWVFNNEIETITGRFHNGDIVLVHDFDGYPMGKGYINQNSKIRVRLLTRHVDQEIDEAFSRCVCRMHGITEKIQWTLHPVVWCLVRQISCRES